MFFNKLFKFIMLITILTSFAVFSGCGGGNPVTPPTVEPDDSDIPEPTEAISQKIDLSLGGDIEVTDPESIINGVKLIIPPTSSNKDGKDSIANITISYIDDPYSLELPDNRGFLLPPVVINSDILFDAECILEIPYTEDNLSNVGLSSNENIKVYYYNYYTSSWEEVSINKGNYKAEIDFDYMLELTLLIEEPNMTYACSTPSIFLPPHGFPQPGDLLYKLSFYGISEGWIPGHVGIYVGEHEKDSEGEPYNVIEALLFGGVQRNYYNPISKFSGSATYMGAGQPKEFDTLTSVQRDIIVDYAKGMVSLPYAIETFSFYFGLARGDWVKGTDALGSYNCVGLAEKAYEIAGVNGGQGLVSDLDEGNFCILLSPTCVLTPVEQYAKTEPAEGYSVSGKVTDSQGVEIPDVTLNLELVSFNDYHPDPIKVTTDSNGDWSSPKLGREWNVTPQKDGYTFEPSTLHEGWVKSDPSTWIVKGNANNIDFIRTLVIPKTYTINASAGPNGSISPSGDVTVNQGSDQSFTITPDTGYQIDDVLVDGSTVGAVSSRTFTNVTENHTISATFKSLDVISATINSYSPSSKITVNTGQSFTISTSFTNTGNTAAYFYPGVSIWNSNGSLIFTDWGSKKYLSKNQQSSASWSPTINTPGEYWLQFGIWNEAKSELLDKEPSPSQNLIKVTEPTTISATINSYSPSSKITVNTGQSFTISTSFTNTGNTAAYFYPGVSIWNSNGSLIFTDWGSKKYLSKNQQSSASWSPTINTPGEYWLQFGIWNEAKSELLDKEPSPSQNLIKVTEPTTISATINSYSPSSKITVNTGQSFTISTSFTNTGNTAAYFYPGVSIWNSNGSLIFTDWGSKKYLSKNQQSSASWSPTINTPGEYWLQFGIWNEAKSELLDKEPSPSQNLIKVTEPTTISATINSYSPSSKITVNTGQSFTISTSFTNTGNTAAYFYPGVSIWNSNGSLVFTDWGGKIYLNQGQQKSESWYPTINTPGEYWIQFGIWNEAKSELLDKKPSPSQNLIKVVSSSSQIERITNGSFSSGASGWTLVGDFWAGTNLSNYHTSPGYSAGGVDSIGLPKNKAAGWMYQNVAIPSGATLATLSFWYNITSEETSSTSYDVLNITIKNSLGDYLATVAVLSNLNKSTLGSYKKITFDMTPYKGQTVRIHFLTTTDDYLHTVFRIDDVSLMSDG